MMNPSGATVTPAGDRNVWACTLAASRNRERTAVRSVNRFVSVVELMSTTYQQLVQVATVSVRDRTKK
jgi:hypothetical protein